MRALDLSPAMIGKTIRVDKYYPDGKHNWIKGTLTELSIETEEIYSNDGTLTRVVDARVIAVRVTIAGLKFILDGTEQLTIVEDEK